jgi:hypothetical protein
MHLCRLSLTSKSVCINHMQKLHGNLLGSYEKLVCPTSKNDYFLSNYFRRGFFCGPIES